MLHRAGVVLLALLLAGCVTLRTPNQPIDQIDHELGYRPAAKDARHGSGRVRLLVSFSGGGTRAAALAYGVLEKLRDTEVAIEGKRGRLLDEVDVISGVSGGSFPAAYFGVYGDRLFEDFEERFLRHNIEGALIARALLPWNAVMLMTPALNRTMLASDYYAKQVFDGATFADLDKASGPRVFINATDLTEGSRFTFSQGGFDVICSNLDAFPISAAVAASSAVPGVLSPLTLRNYAGRCGFTPPDWFQEALDARESDPRRYRAARARLPYLEPKKKAYIHLVDGGIADNLGLRIAVDRVLAVGGVEHFLELQHRKPPDHIVVIVVNAETAPDPALDLRAAAPGLFETISLVSGSQIRRINFDTLDIVTEAIARWASELSTPGHNVTSHVVEVSFDHVRDPKESAYLKALPTSFALSDEQVDHLRQAGHTLLENSPQFNEVLGLLR